MTNKDALVIANALLCEIRLLLNQNKVEQAALLADIGKTLPVDEQNRVREAITYDKLFNYLNTYPERQQLLHFHALLDINTAVADVATA